MIIIIIIYLHAVVFVRLRIYVRYRFFYQLYIGKKNTIPVVIPYTDIIPNNAIRNYYLKLLSIELSYICDNKNYWQRLVRWF